MGEITKPRNPRSANEAMSIGFIHGIFMERGLEVSSIMDSKGNHLNQLYVVTPGNDHIYITVDRVSENHRIEDLQEIASDLKKDLE